MMLFQVHWFSSYSLGHITFRVDISQVTLSVVDITISNVKTTKQHNVFKVTTVNQNILSKRCDAKLVMQIPCITIISNVGR